MGIRERLSGNEAVAYAMKQINPDVMGVLRYNYGRKNVKNRKHRAY